MFSLRPITDADLPFLRRLYATTRREEMALVPWAEEEKAAFLDMQFEAQHSFYTEQFPAATFDVVTVDGHAAGRLYVDCRADEVRLIDIALLPEWRRRGIGSELLRRILEEAEAAGKPVRIHVERHNPALGLYESLGFDRLEDQGVYQLMEWRPAAVVVGESETSS